MENGLAIIEVNDTETKGFYIDQDALECARLNALTSKQLKKVEAKKREADHRQRMVEKAKARRKAYTLNTIGYILIRCGVSVAAAWGMIAGLIHPVITIPVILLSICTACVRLGMWMAKAVK